MAENPSIPSPILVTGATGYVGGRLVPALLQAGHRVHCVVREPRKLEARLWRNDPRVSIATSDLADAASLAEHMQGCAAAYYLVHSMEATGRQYAERDQHCASNFARAAAAAGLPRIIYLGGLGEMGPHLSEHLRSRREVEHQLASTGVPVTTLRAAMIIGAGSASFEILRYLVERLPMMVTPAWVKTETQPVAITDVLHWLVRSLDVPETIGKTLEIGGADVLPYRALMDIMAEELGLHRRLIVPLPVLTPRLSSLWISLVTPVSYRIARPLAEGLRNRVVVTDHAIEHLMPHEPLGVRAAIRQALRHVEANDVETRWSAAGPIPGDPTWAGGTSFRDRRSVSIRAQPAAVFRAVCRIGGGHGWYAGDILWRLRGWMDTLVGGPGLRRGRRHPEQVEFGEALDFWRVVGIERDRSLSLRAEMKLPGEALLQFDLEPEEDRERTRLTMTARYRPQGLLGILYWYAVLPLHNLVFGGMLKGIRHTAETLERTENDAALSRDDQPSQGYGRARLWLGISAVGCIVTLAAVGLAIDFGGMVQRQVDAGTLGAPVALLAFVLAYAAVHLPFDLMGGYLLPRRFGRSHPPLGRFLVGLARGVATHVALLTTTTLALLAAGKFGGLAGVLGAGVLMIVFLLGTRAGLAASMARLEWSANEPNLGPQAAGLPIRMVRAQDEGFTGGVLGTINPRAHLLPETWREKLGPDRFEIAVRRRSAAVATGSWRRGRMAALLFTVVGLALAGWLTGPAALGTVGGTIAFSLWFTLWSFLGLLTLPTISRRGVLEVDERIQAEGCSSEALRSTTRLLNELQDGETDRPSFVETIFHPIPSVRSRLEGPRPDGAFGFWDAARTAVYLSLAGAGLLGRAVHCNCGRPALWVFLPTD